MKEVLDKHEQERAARFLKHLAIATSRIEHRKEARKVLENQIQNIKRISNQRTKDKTLLEKEINSLRDQIDHVLDIETKLIHHVTSEKDSDKGIKRHIEKLENKIDNYEKARLDRQKRIDELERKIKGSFETKSKSSEIAQLENHIGLIERQTAMLEKQGKAKAEDIANLRRKISEYKKRIAELKNR